MEWPEPSLIANDANIPRYLPRQQSLYVVDSNGLLIPVAANDRNQPFHRFGGYSRRRRHRRHSDDSQSGISVVLPRRPRSHSRSHSRPRQHSPRPHDRYNYSNESRGSKADSDDDYSHVYSFSLTHHARKPLSQDGTLSSLSEKQEGGPMPAAPQNLINSIKPEGIHHILRSVYVGEGLIGGLHAAKLSIVKSENNDVHKCAALFRWV